MQQDRILEGYQSLMEETKWRLHAVNLAYRNEAVLPPGMVREVCYLQFRFICEVIAVGCLLAHGDIQATAPIRDTYEPGKIIKQLAKINPSFYPQPMQEQKEGKVVSLSARPDVPHLSRQELPKLWGRAGDALHRTPLIKVIDPAQFDPTFPDVFGLQK